MDNRQMARLYAASRVGIGLALTLLPGLALRVMLGGARGPGAAGMKMVARLLGVRDALLGAGALAALRGGGRDIPARWLTYGAVADGADVVSILLAYRSLPPRKRFLMAVAGAAGSATGAYLATRPDVSNSAS